MPGINYNEIVDVLAIDTPAEISGELHRGGRVATVPLHKAVRMIVEDWAGSGPKQLSAMIVREGRSITRFEGIRRIYDREDFPRLSE